ncbi:MAG: hypothetical protein M1308_14130 [Actinobacteria bacterium]|nr:hypothetical protein [Actinomycetota bacterium]
MSEIIASVIFILLAIIAVGILWAIISNVLNKSKDNASLDTLLSSAEIVEAQTKEIPNGVSITVKRTMGEGNISLKFILENGTKTIEYIAPQQLKELETKTYTISVYPNLGSIDKITLIPFIYQNDKPKYIKQTDTQTTSIIYYEGNSGNCVDSDFSKDTLEHQKGFEIYKKGTVTHNGNQYIDVKTINGIVQSTIREYYCENDIMVSMLVECPPRLTPNSIAPEGYCNQQGSDI